MYIISIILLVLIRCCRHASEHIFADNPILVREDEPSSILAFTLSSVGIIFRSARDS